MTPRETLDEIADLILQASEALKAIDLPREARWAISGPLDQAMLHAIVQAGNLRRAERRSSLLALPAASQVRQ